MAAEGIGVDGLHCISGMCDLCGEACDANTQELNVLSCTFKNCEDLPYHQDCLEKYLKSIRLERNRKTGFKCPRGCGKGTQHPGPCPGKIDKSHPIHPRNEEQKKKKKAKLPEIMAVAPARVIKTKEEKKAEKEKAKAAAAAAAAADKAKAAKAAATTKPPAAPVAAAATSSKAAKQQQQQPDSKKLAEAVAAARREIAATRTNKQTDQGQPSRDASPSQPEYKTLDAYLRESNAASAAPTPATPVVNAWAKPPAPAAPAAHALTGGHQQQRHRPAEPSRLQAVISARDVSPGAPAAPAPPAAARAAAAGRPAAAAASAGLPPMPHPQPATPAAAAAAMQQAHALHHVPSIHSHPLATQGSTASLVSQASGGANGLLPVGAEYVGDEGSLTKAQRKNLKRAEKKKRGHLPEAAGSSTAPVSAQPGVPAAAAVTAAAAGGAASAAAGSSPSAKLSRLAVGSGGVGGGGLAAGGAGSSSLSRHASSNSDSLATAALSSTAAAAAAACAGPSTSGVGDAQDDEETVALMHELAVHALLAKKTLALVASLQRLGFTEWQAAAAVQRHGSELEDAVAWLLDGGAPDPLAAAQVSAGHVADVSIVEELRLMEALGAALPHLPRAQLYIAVADAGGDLDKAAAAAMQQHAEIVAAAEAAAAAAAVTPADSTCSPMASVSVTASPTSTSSAVQQQQQQQLPPKQQVVQHQQQQLLPNGLSSVTESDVSGFGSSLGLYPASPGLTAGHTAAGFEAPLLSATAESQPSSSGFGSWFVPGRSSGGLGASALTAHPLQDLPSTSSLAQLEAAASGFGSYVPGSATAAAAAALGSNIWGTSSLDAVNSSAGWSPLAQVSSAQPGDFLQGAASSSLFGQGSLDTGALGGWGSSTLTGHSGLGLLGSQAAPADALLNPYTPFGGGTSLFAGSTLAPAAQQPATTNSPAAGDAVLQQSRLFSSYGVSQPSLFSNAGVNQQQAAGAGWSGVATAGVSAAAAAPETAGSADTDDDLEGLLATLMCH